MVYKVHAPNNRLKPYIKCFWLLQGNGGQGHAEKILPDGCIEMILHYGDVFSRISDDGMKQIQPGGFIIGQIKKYMEVAPASDIGVVGIRFYPNGLSAFTNMPVYELTGHTVLLNDIFGKEASEIQERLVDGVAEEKINIVQNFLTQKLLENKKFDFVTDTIVKKIQHQKGQVNLHSLLKSFKISERHFERQFKIAVGLNAKFFSRLTRFHHIMRMLQEGDHTRADAAHYLGGYYDQSHFIKDFVEFTGENPGSYFGNGHVLSTLFLTE